MSLADVERLAVRLVQEAPLLDPLVIGSLRDELAAVGSPLALTISRIVELVGEGLVDPAISLPAIAEACATLVAGVEGRLDERTLAAAQYQIDTLTPMPDRPPSRVAVPDVPAIDLVRRRDKKT